MNEFHAVVLGPEGTPYEGGEWHYEFRLNYMFTFNKTLDLTYG